jgi:hypothetical protein
MQDLYQQLVDWHRLRHAVSIINTPSPSSAAWLKTLISEILLPLQQLGEIRVTYGFVGYELNKYIQKHSPSGTAPILDQHASCETNLKDHFICNRPGAACDILITGYEDRMQLVAQYIIQNLHYDRLYFYGRNRPIHVSVAPQNTYQLQVMNQSDKGRRYPGKRAYGKNAQTLAAEL